MAGEDLSGRLSVLVLWLVCMACAHGRAESLDERSAALLVAVRYTMLKLASPDIRADDRRTWEAIPFCIDVDEQPPDSAILNVLRTEGFEVHGDKRECMRSDRFGRLVHVSDLRILGESATARVGSPGERAEH